MTENLPILIGYSLLRISSILKSLSCFLFKTELTEVLNQVLHRIVLTFISFNLIYDWFFYNQVHYCASIWWVYRDIVVSLYMDFLDMWDCYFEFQYWILDEELSPLNWYIQNYSTVTDFARFLGLSTSVFFRSATW